MSVVAVKVYKNRIVIGADSFISFGYYTQRKDEGAKIFKQNNMVVGCVGYAKDMTLFKLYCRDRKPARNDEEAIIDFMAEFIKWAKAIDKDYKCRSSFMIVYQKKAWLVDDSFYLNEITTFQAMGAGQDMAQTAMHLGRSVKEAIAVACEISIYCEKPVVTFEVRR